MSAFVDVSGWDLVDTGSQVIVVDSPAQIGYVRRLYHHIYSDASAVPFVEVRMTHCIMKIPSSRVLRIVSYGGWRWFKPFFLNMTFSPKRGDTVLVWSVKQREYKFSELVSTDGTMARIVYSRKEFEVPMNHVHMRLFKRGKVA